MANRQLKIKQQDQIIKVQNGIILNHVEKSIIQVEETIYYRELIQDRDKSINNLKRKNKILKIGCISFGSSALILGGYVYLNQ